MKLHPVALSPELWPTARWSVYLIRVQLLGDVSDTALKVGMVGTGTVASRMKDHARQFGEADLLNVWTLEHEVRELEEIIKWRIVEQYEAKLQHSPEFEHPGRPLRRLRPDTKVHSFEWFVDDNRVVDAVRLWALSPIAIPAGWP